MPPPLPLTRTPAPSLDFSRPGTPVAQDFGDIYFSTDGGLDETRAVFLAGCGLPERWMDQSVFTVAELGFGSGLNFLATWQAWQDSGAKGRLHYISVEGFPFDQAALAQALSAFPDLSDYAQPLMQRWPGPVKGIHRRHFGSVTLTLLHDSVAPALASQDFQADAWYLDGFSPSKNSDMWQPDILSEVARLSAPGARLATFTVAGAVRRALDAVGYQVDRQPGFGRKRHRLEGRLPGTPKPYTHPVTPTIIGAGIAGASIAHAFQRRGIKPRVVYDPAHVEASGNGVALIKPRFDLQDNPAARFFLSSFLYAREAYEPAVLETGILHKPKDMADTARFAQLIDQNALGEEHRGGGHMHWVEDSLFLESSLVIDTKRSRSTFLGDIQPEPTVIDDLSSLQGPVIVAAGYGIRTLLPEAAFRFARGQLSLTSGALAHPTTYGGYALNYGDHILLGATHDRITDHSTAFTVREADDVRNLAQALEHGLSLGPLVQPYRASVRVNSPDTLPRLSYFTHTKTEQDVWVLSGLGSRGFVFAPLLGEALVSAYCGEPSPLDRTFRDRISRLPA